MGKDEIELECPRCGNYIYEYMPFRKKNVKVQVKCEECGLVIEV
ncbi:MAG: hypothetical protein OEZ35_04565 [Candidatus Bathyarchaeota archaeon]|nr:hypothetical protein [Candidatus Bathyarchaeota archaeon]